MLSFFFLFFFFFKLSRHNYGYPHAIFRGFISIFAGGTRLCKELIVADDSAHITMKCIITFESSLDLHADVNVV